MHTRDSIKKACQEIFTQVFSDSSLTISEKTSASDIPTWDSLAQIQLLMALEISFGIQFSMDEVDDLKNVREIIDLIILKTTT